MKTSLLFDFTVDKATKNSICKQSNLILAGLSHGMGCFY